MADDYSIKVGIRVVDEATPALRRIGQTSQQAGRTTATAFAGAARGVDQIGAAAGRSTTGVRQAASSWASAARQGGTAAGRAGGEGLTSGVRDGASRSSSALRSATSSWSADARRGGEAAGRAGGDGVAMGMRSGAASSATALRGAGQAWASDARAAGRRAGESAGDGISTGIRGRMRGVGSDLKAELAAALPATLGAGLVASFAGAGKVIMDFDKAMSGVRANITASPSEFAALRESVRTAGTQFGFTASESAAATEDLAKAGLNASQIMGGGLTGALTLAAAGGISTANAAETAATAMTMFGLKAQDVGHIADVLANGANASTASVDSLSQGMSQGGMQAAQMGMSLEQTVGALAMFDQAGLKGADAGTSLKTMLIALSNPSKKASETMSQLGISAFDASGKFVGMQSLADQLNRSLAGMSQEQRNAAIATIFGSDASRAAAVAMSSYSGAAAKGGKSVDEWVAAVSKQGTAAENAKTRMDNLAGKMRVLWAEIQSAIIGLGGAASGPLGQIVDLASSGVGAIAALAQAFGSLPGPVQNVVAALVAFRVAQAALGDRSPVGSLRSFASGLREVSQMTGAVVKTASGAEQTMGRFGSSIAAIGRDVPAVARMQQAFVSAAAGAERFPRAAGTASAAMSGIKTAASGLMGVMGGPWGVAMAGAGVALSLWQQHQQEAAQKVAAHKAQVEQLTSAIQQDGGAMGESSRAAIADALAKDKAFEAGRKLGLSVQDITMAAQGYAPAQEKVNSALQNSAAAWQMVEHGVGDNVYYTREMTSAATTVKGAIDGQTGATKEAAAAAKDHAAAMSATKTGFDAANQGAVSAKASMATLSAQVKQADTAAGNMVASMEKLGSTFLEMQGGEIGWEAAIDSATAAITKNGRTLDIHTEQGRANKQELIGLANAGLKMAQDMAANGASAAEITAHYGQMRTQLISTAQAMGMSAAEAKKFADEAIQIPSTVKVSLQADTAAATTALQTIRADAMSLDGKNVKIAASALNTEQTKALLAGVAGARKNADGSVSIPTSAMNTEQTKAALRGVENAAVTADGKVVVIPASTPNAPQVKALLESVSGAALSADAKSISIPVAAGQAPAVKKAIEGVTGAAISADAKTVTIPTSAPGAAAAETAVKNALAAAHNKTVTITVNRAINETFAKVHDLMPFGGSHSARGNLFPGGGRPPVAFARGGVRGGARERHVAQIARAGEWRVWAEDETGGEAYVPLRNDGRRGRAKAITEEVVHRFGGDVTWHADGAYRGQERLVSAPVVTRGASAGEIAAAVDAALGSRLARLGPKEIYALSAEGGRQLRRV